MADFVGLVINFPATVEGIVKACRKIQEYKHLQANHTMLISRSIFACRKLAYYVSFIDVEPDGTVSTTSSSQRQNLLEEAVFHASDAMLKMAQVLENWSIRLHLANEANSRLFLARMAEKIAGTLMRKYKIISLSRFEQSKVGKLASEIAYLSMGCRQINDAMEALDRWIADIRDILLSSQSLRYVRNPISHTDVNSMRDVFDDVLFVARCRQRVEMNIPVQRIDASEIELYGDLDPTRPTGFFMIETGRYVGCLIDRRDMNHLYVQERHDQAVSETDHIARLFAEERSGTAITTLLASVGILPCCGWAKTSAQFLSTEHDLVFRPPAGSRRPRTLRMLLLYGTPRHSLELRLKFSIQLATSVLMIHSLGLVHKDIRPDSVLVFEPLKGNEDSLFPNRLGTPFLGKFDRARPDDADTVVNPFKYSPYMDMVYTHPVHTTSVEHVRYHMRDDIYSLGVVLIEVALWRSLFSWSEKLECYDVDFSWFDFSIEKYKRIFLEMGQPEYRNRGWLVRWDLIELAETEIPAIMGTTFKDVVVSCLTFGEETKPTFDESVMKITETQDYEARDESINFVQDILRKLRSLRFS